MADDLEPPLKTLIPRMQPGQVSAPLPLQDGIRIIVLIDRRLVGISGNAEAARASLHQLVLPIPEDADRETVGKARERLAKLATGIQGCSDAERVAERENLPLSGSLGDLKLGDLPANIQEAVLATSEGRASAPLQVGSHLAVLTVCSKSVPQGSLPSAEAIRSQLRNRKIERLAEQYLRDLRQGAFIDIRGT
jgi:peptidyl-prolyl cis-trans isomerase SurA